MSLINLLIPANGVSIEKTETTCNLIFDIRTNTGNIVTYKLNILTMRFSYLDFTKSVTLLDGYLPSVNSNTAMYTNDPYILTDNTTPLYQRYNTTPFIFNGRSIYCNQLMVYKYSDTSDNRLGNKFSDTIDNQRFLIESGYNMNKLGMPRIGFDLSYSNIGEFSNFTHFGKIVQTVTTNKHHDDIEFLSGIYIGTYSKYKYYLYLTNVNNVSIKIIRINFITGEQDTSYKFVINLLGLDVSIDYDTVSKLTVINDTTIINKGYIHLDNLLKLVIDTFNKSISYDFSNASLDMYTYIDDSSFDKQYLSSVGLTAISDFTMKYELYKDTGIYVEKPNTTNLTIKPYYIYSGLCRKYIEITGCRDFTTFTPNTGKSIKFIDKGLQYNVYIEKILESSSYFTLNVKSYDGSDIFGNGVVYTGYMMFEDALGDTLRNTEILCTAGTDAIFTNRGISKYNDNFTKDTIQIMTVYEEYPDGTYLASTPSSTPITYNIPDKLGAFYSTIDGTDITPIQNVIDYYVQASSYITFCSNQDEVDSIIETKTGNPKKLMPNIYSTEYANSTVITSVNTKLESDTSYFTLPDNVITYRTNTDRICSSSCTVDFIGEHISPVDNLIIDVEKFNSFSNVTSNSSFTSFYKYDTDYLITYERAVNKDIELPSLIRSFNISVYKYNIYNKEYVLIDSNCFLNNIYLETITDNFNNIVGNKHVGNGYGMFDIGEIVTYIGYDGTKYYYYLLDPIQFYTNSAVIYYTNSNYDIPTERSMNEQ